MRVSRKKAKQISSTIEHVISLIQVPEFNEYQYGTPLFHDPPESWNKLEEAVYEYQERIKEELKQHIGKILEVEL